MDQPSVAAGDWPAANEHENEYEVEKILRVKGRGHTMRYLIKWKGFGDDWNTWEPRSNLIGCEAALQAFTSEQQQKKRQQKRKNKKQPQAAEAPQTAVDFPKEDQQQQQQEQQERQNSQSDSQGLFNKFRSASGSSTFTAVASHPAVDDSAASLTNFYYKSGGELDRFLDSLSALDHCPTVASLPDCLSSSPSKASSRLIAAVEANSLGDLIRLLHSPASSAAGACDLNWADEARNGETALTAALRQGNVAAVRLLLQHGCAVNAWCQLPAASALSASSSGDAAGNDRQQQQFKDPIVVARSCPLAGELLCLLQRHCDAVSQALADCAQSALGSSARLLAPVGRLHILPRPGLSVQFDIADRLPSLPCVLLLGNAVFNTGAEATAAPLVRLRGRCSVREVWLNNVRQMPLSQAGCFICTCAPLRVGSNTVGLVPSGSFRLPADGRFRLLVRAYEVKVLAESGAA
ncbi:hypothetical protein BOX15_Mlig011412g1 [Macrostomum lignano]|uniref:Chromo domain-containing protein n=1 Tax=Macrostomum lignano TaxID=282301 RepID=A0A267DLP5_9PLAT|nr:hypothetical protein BOX15_Mlig011412g1 [Macrostomum lignano]